MKTGRESSSESATAAAGVAIFDEAGAVLLGRHAHDGCWATFGGAVEPGEDLRAAALREVREEIGVALDHVRLLDTFGGSDIYTVRYQDGSSEDYEVTMFCAQLTSRCVPRPDMTEIVEVQWFSRANVRSVALAPDMMEILPAAFDWSERRAIQRGS